MDGCVACHHFLLCFSVPHLVLFSIFGWWAKQKLQRPVGLALAGTARRNWRQVSYNQAVRTSD